MERISPSWQMTDTVDCCDVDVDNVETACADCDFDCDCNSGSSTNKGLAGIQPSLTFLMKTTVIGFGSTCELTSFVTSLTSSFGSSCWSSYNMFVENAFL